MDACALNVSQFVVSVCKLHNIREAKGEALPKSLLLPVKVEAAPGSYRSHATNSQMDAGHLALHV